VFDHDSPSEHVVFEERHKKIVDLTLGVLDFGAE
jgi:hypothetical protein